MKTIKARIEELEAGSAWMVHYSSEDGVLLETAFLAQRYVLERSERHVKETGKSEAVSIEWSTISRVGDMVVRALVS